MEMGIRGWMIVIGILLVLAVLLDGYRRIRNERRGAIRMSLKMGGGFDKDELDELPNSELPNGKARVIPRANADFGGRSPEGDENDFDLPPMSAVDNDLDPESVSSHYSYEKSGAEETTQTPEQKEIASQPEELIVINVMSRSDTGFVGEDLLHILLACDLRLGKRNILHRYENENGQGPVQFSIANVLEPGIFDMDNIKSFATPGIIFFMSLPGPKDPLKAFEYMVETAQCVVKNLNGELKDEAHSVMTAQTLEHCRQRIKDFERRQLVQPA